VNAPVLATVEQATLATVQDLGRAAATVIGVPRAGAWHRQRYGLATALVAPDPEPTTPTIELLAGTIVLRARAVTAAAVVGPAAVILRGTDAPTDTTLALAVDDVLTVRHEGPGPVYVALAGWREPLVLGSASTDTFSRLGGRLLAAGDELCGHGDMTEVGSFARVSWARPVRLRVIPSPGMSAARVEWDTGEWDVTTTARSGTRLGGAPAGGDGMGPSRPMVVGAIQVTPAGEGIILGPDGGLTGGYAVIGAVISADLDDVSLLAPGDRIALAHVDVDEAARVYDEAERALRRSIVRPHVIG